MLSLTIDEARFNFRAAGICIEHDYVLLQQFAGAEYWILPGGRVEMREQTTSALRREWQEELGETVAVQRLLWVVENFYEDEYANHELGFYYQLALPAASVYSDKTRVYAGADGGTAFILRWFPVASLADVLLYPPFLRARLGALPTTLEHIVAYR